jgi:hypothetical protein
LASSIFLLIFVLKLKLNIIMGTLHNVFVRKYGKLAIVIAVTDWDDFKTLEKHSVHEDPDFLMGGVTSSGNIYTSMNMQMTLSTNGEVKDITEETKGAGLASILTGSSNAGRIWSFQKLKGV